MRPLFKQFQPLTTRPTDRPQHSRSPTPVDFPASPGPAPRLTPQRWSPNAGGRKAAMTEHPPTPPRARLSLTAPGPRRPRRVRATASAPPTPPGASLIGDQPRPPLDGQLARPTAGGRAGACAARGRGRARGRAEGGRMGGGAALRAWRVWAKRGLLAQQGSHVGRKGLLSTVGKQRRAEGLGVCWEVARAEGTPKGYLCFLPLCRWFPHSCPLTVGR